MTRDEKVKLPFISGQANSFYIIQIPDKGKKFLGEEISQTSSIRENFFVKFFTHSKFVKKLNDPTTKYCLTVDSLGSLHAFLKPLFFTALSILRSIIKA